MDTNEKWLQWAVELNAIAQAGLFYQNNAFDRERFERVRDISAEMVAHQADIPFDKARDLFCGDTGYQTPKLDSRAAIFQQDRILLVQEKNGEWSLPGGWVEAWLSVAENTVKEVKEEAGLDAVVEKVIAIQDRDKHNLPVYAYKICKVFSLCSVTGGHYEENLETVSSGYFSMDSLPPLAAEKNTREQIQMCFDAYHSEHWQTLID